MQAALPLLQCPYCASPAISRLEAEVADLGRRPMPGRWIWLCSRFPECDARVGCHAGTSTPLGHLANKRLRDLRMETHKLFDPLWLAKMRKQDIQKGHARRLAYEWLSGQMGLPRKDCHIAMFNEQQCEQAIAILKPYERKRA